MKNIPTEAAFTVAKKYDAPVVVVAAHDPLTGKTQITTFGRNKDERNKAAQIGNAVRLGLGINLLIT